MIGAYLGLVASLARRYAGWGVPVEDLIQEGSLALVQAIDHFDPGRGMQLSTYLTWWVRQAIRRAAMAQSRPFRVPEKVWERSLEVTRAEEELRSRLAREVSEGDLAGSLGWSADELGDVRRAVRSVASLEGAVGDEESELGELLADPDAEDPAEITARNDARRRLASALAALPERRSAVLTKRYGLDGRSESLNAIGEELGVSRERARQIENSALDELRRRRWEFGLEGLAA
ncbi:MAG: sigma-70 family RNA polymerase sigma factor [Actinomycetota bacterium]